MKEEFEKLVAAGKLSRQHVEPLAFKYVHGDSAVEAAGKHDNAFDHMR